MDYSTIQASDVTHTPEKPKNNLFDAFSAALNTYIGVSSAKNSKDKEVAKEAERKKFEQEDRRMKQEANQSTMDYNKARMDSLYGKQNQIDSVADLNKAKANNLDAKTGSIDEETQLKRDKIDSEIEINNAKIAKLENDGSNDDELLLLKEREINLKSDRLVIDKLLKQAQASKLTGAKSSKPADDSKSIKAMGDMLQDVYKFEADARDPLTGKLDVNALRSSEEYKMLKQKFNLVAQSNGFPKYGDPRWNKLADGSATIEELRAPAESTSTPALGGSTEQTTIPANPSQPTPPQIPASIQEKVKMALEQRKAKAQQAQVQQPMPQEQAPQLPPPQAQPQPNLPSQQIEQPLDKLKTDPDKEFATPQSDPYQGLYGKDKASNEPRPQENLVPTLRGSSDVKSRTEKLYDKVSGVSKEGVKKAADLFAFVVDDQTARSKQIFNVAKVAGVGSDDQIQKGMKEGQKIRSYEAPHLKESIEKAMENMNDEANKKFLAQIVKNGGNIRVGKTNVKVLSDVELKALQNYLQF